MIVFAVLGIFSARYRSLAREAFDCVFNRVRLKPCESGLDQKVKNKIIGKVFKRNKKIAGVLNRYFEVFSWTLVILLVVSLAFAANGLYNYFAFGNCNGPQAPDGSCILPGSGDRTDIEYENIKLSQVDYSDNPTMGPKNASLTILEFGCFACPYTYSIQSELGKLMENYGDKVKLVFMHFPLSEHHNSQFLAEASYCAQKQGKFWEYKDKLFMIQGTCGTSEQVNVSNIAIDYAREVGINITRFRSCLNSDNAYKTIMEDKRQGLGLGVDKTPTLFINDTKVEGYKTYKELKRIVERELNEGDVK
ncbi:MAG: DsbA family protein [Candidatus Aenigmatarchaeota archaeon]